MPVLALLFGAGMVGLLLHLNGLSDCIVESAALQQARALSDSLAEFRKLYSSEVVARVQGHGIEITHDYAEREGAIPLPATLSILLAEQIGTHGSGTTTRLYSDYPFPWRKDNGPRDDFERAALHHLRADPATPYVRYEEFAGEASVRYATADVMGASCVSCHNTHPDSPKRDWREGDVRGVLEVVLPLRTVAVQARSNSRLAVVLAAILALAGLGVGVASIVRLRSRNRSIEATVSRRTAELRAALEQNVRHLSELTEGRARLDAVLQAAACGIITIDGLGVVTSFNRAAARMFQYEACEVVGKNVKMLMPSPYREEHDSYLARHRDTGEDRILGRDREVAGRRQDGSLFPLRLGVSRVASTGWFTGIVEDLTEINSRTAAVEAAADMIVITDREGRIQYVNRAFVEGTGYSVEEAVGSSPSLLKSGRHDAAFYERMWNTIRDGAVWSGEMINRRKDGSLYPEEMTIAPVKDATGVVTQFVAIKRDITERKRMEGDLAKARDEAQAGARAKSEFLANMSHEIRTPMNAVIGMTGLLLDTDLSSEQRECAEIVRTAGETLLSVVNEILDFSKIEAGKLELEVLDFGLIQLVEDVAALLAGQAAGKGIELACSLDPALPPRVRGDAARLRQILINLVGNAVKFTSEGEVCVKVELVEETAEQALVRFEVIDTGIGVPLDVQGCLFEAFSQADGSTTRRFGGTGLGLAISRRLAELMGGEIGIESDGLHGSRFWFTVRVERSAEPDSVGSVPRCDLSGLRVLVIDDNATNRTILRSQLRNWGMRCSEASNGPDGIERLRSAARDRSPFHVLLLDMQMPDMDGLAVARAVRNDPVMGGLHLILLTSMGMHDLRQETREAGVAACLTKPVRQSGLFDCLLEVTSGTPAQPEPAVAADERLVSGRILVVEDNAVNQKVAVRLLQKLGHVADVAGNGQEALDALRTIPYDLVLMDCSMPVMDGYEATEAIRQQEDAEGRPRLPVLALTANAMDGDAAKCLAAGMDDYITKPISKERLAHAIDRWLVRCESR